MGEEGSKLTAGATESVAVFVDRLRPLGDISSKKMFGCYGVFESGKMFGLANSEGLVFLKAAGEAIQNSIG